MPIPPTTPIVTARPMPSTTLSPPSPHFQQAKISPAYWTGMKR